MGASMVTVAVCEPGQCGAGRPLTAKQLLTSNNVSPPVAAEALYAALDDLMARAGALTAERK